MINVLFSAPKSYWETYAPLLPKACADLGLEINLAQEHQPNEVDYIVYAPNTRLTDFTPFERCKGVLSLWAGVETIAPNTTLSQPLARLVDVGLTQGMVEWVAGHVLRHHLGMDSDIRNQTGAWNFHVPPLASERHVTILGLGELGSACAKSLAALGFNVTGWARSPKAIGGVNCLHGDAGLKEALHTAETLVLLLPLTAQTENILDAAALAELPAGAIIVNPGRGALIDDEALLSALDRGHIRHATLDVFRIEPLPTEHPYWAHPNVTVTPHIASATRPETAVHQIAENIRRGEAGLPLLNLVDRRRGY